MAIAPGILYVVATPIGNLADLTERAKTVLQTVATIAAEDTRHSRKLLDFYGISTPLVALHEHNEKSVTETLVRQLQQGQSLALISDAGTPLISDPGFYLIRAALVAQLKVSPIPGACSLIAALSVAGLPTTQFVFEGFLPPKSNARRVKLQALAGEPRTLIFLEAPHRIAEALIDLAEIFGDDRQATVCRELTKTFEEIRLSSLRELAIYFADELRQRGEFVLLVEGMKIAPTVDPESERVLALLLAELPLKKAVSLAADITQKPRNTLYALALKLKTGGE